MKPRTMGNPFPALDRLESAGHLVRATPVRDHLLWLLGSGPYALGLLYFWAEQSRSSLAAERLPLSSFGLALLFLWARLTQAVVAARRHDQWMGSDDRKDVLTLLRQVAVPIVVWQPLALALLPVTLILVIPFPAFLTVQQGLIVTAHRADGSALRALALAVRHARHSPNQASQEASLLAMVWLVLAVNIGVVLYGLPLLAKLLLGIESPFTLNPSTVLNSTFAAAVVVLATLLTDPLVKAVSVLRDVESESRSTGADLRAALRRIPLVMVLTLLLLSGFPSLHAAARADDPVTLPRSARPIPSAELNRAIVEVLERPEFSWRAPRTTGGDAENASDRTPLQRLLARLGKFLDGVARRMEAPIKAIGDWLGRLFGSRTPAAGPLPRLDISGLVEFLMWLLIAGASLILGGMGLRLWRQRPAATRPPASALPVVPDLESETIAAEQLPVDDWQALARDLAERGEYRHAVRALFLACLAGLAEQEQIRLARSKSNRDYLNEVRRRSPDQPQRSETFSEIVRVFEGAWYGGRPVTPDRFADVAAAVERLRAP